MRLRSFRGLVDGVEIDFGFELKCEITGRTISWKGSNVRMGRWLVGLLPDPDSGDYTT